MNTGTDTHIRRTLHEDEGRDQDDASTRQGMPKITSIPPEAREKAWNRFSLSPQKKLALLIPWL